MEDRFNTIAGWALFAGIVGLGLSSVSSHYFSADKPHRPHTMGFEIEGVEAEGGAEEGPPLATLLATADVAKGEAVFAKCVSCHTINAGGANGIGPNLHAAMGAAIGKHVPGFAYSEALKSHGGNWTWENMDAWLKSPKAFASGTKMTFAGLGKAEDRAALRRGESGPRAGESGTRSGDGAVHLIAARFIRRVGDRAGDGVDHVEAACACFLVSAVDELSQ